MTDEENQVNTGPTATRRQLLKATAAAAAVAGGLPALGSAAHAAPAGSVSAGPLVPRSTPHGLLTSLLADPLGVEPGRPRLSWIVPDLLPSTRQVAYQVQVARTAHELVAHGGAVWDSGRVASGDSVAVEYAGPPLEPAAVYHWRVRAWVVDAHAGGTPAPGKASEWSEPQRVVTAAGDTWDAVPIWARDGSVVLRDGRLDVDVTITTVSVGLFLRARDLNNAYMWQIMAGSPGRIRPHVRINGTYTLFEDVNLPVAVPVGTPFRLSVELDGPIIRTYIDDTLVHERSDPRYQEGTFGFRNGSTESQRIHAVRFTDADGEVRVDEDFAAGPGPFAGGTVQNGDLVVGTSAQLLAQLGETRDWAAIRTEFDLPDRPIAAAFLYASGRTPEPARQYVYKAWVNGEFAGVGPARAKGSEARYQTHDVTDLVAPGRNALAALCWAEQERRFLAQLVVVFADGTRQVVGTSGDWRVRRGGRWRPSVGGLNTPYYSAPSEHIDARFEPVGWTEPGFDDDMWEPAEPAAPIGNLRPVPVEPMQITVIRPADVVQLGPGRWRVDLGKEIVGGLRLTVHGTAGTTVEVRLGEELNSDGTVRFQLRAGNVYRETWTLRDGQQSLEHWGYRGFRWVELRTDPGLDLSQAVEGLRLAMAWNTDDASFASSDPDLDRVWEMCRYSIEASRQDVYHDTPTRERGPYEGDAIINQLSEYYTQRSYALARYSATLLASRPTWPTEYRIMGVLLAWEDYLATGDSTHLAVDYDIFVARNLDGFLNGAGLVEKNPGSSSQVNGDLVDWPAANRDGYVFTRVNTVINSWQYAAYAAQARVAAVIGRDDHAALYAGRAASLRAAINRDLLVGGSYVDGVGTTHRAQHATVFPVALGVADVGDLTVLGEWLAQGGMRVSVYGAQFLLDALYRCARGDAALGLMTSRARESWLHMIDDLGATWVMESWDPAIKPNTTFSHAWGSAPANAVGRGLAGVRVLEPGAALVGITPQPGDLEWFDARVPTIRGPVEVSLDRRDGFRLHVVLPPNVSGRLELAAATAGVPNPDDLYVWTRGPAPARQAEAGKLILTDVPPGELLVADTEDDN
jgi:alpha-L-rhamnosidase